MHAQSGFVPVDSTKLADRTKISAHSRFERAAKTLAVFAAYQVS
jgi:hypothetical protein